MKNSTQLWINHRLARKFADKGLRPFDPLPLSSIHFANPQKIYKTVITDEEIPNKRGWYIIKSLPNDESAIRERDLNSKVSSDMLYGQAPLLFPFMYAHYIRNDKLELLFQPAQTTITQVLEKKLVFNELWWATVLYQISIAVQYLESEQINHNDLIFDNIMFQYMSDDPAEIEIMLIDLGSAVQGHLSHSDLPAFVLGRDLNYFLYVLIYDGVAQGYFPKRLAEMLCPLLLWESFDESPTDYLTGLKRVNITHHNWLTSGKNLVKWLIANFPSVTNKCSANRMNKLYGVAIGSLIGDCFGMPIQFDHGHTGSLHELCGSAEYNGLLSAWDLPAGTFTDDTQLGLVMLDTLLSEGRTFIPNTLLTKLCEWVKTDPIDVDPRLSTLCAGDNLTIEEFGLVGPALRVWPIAILYHLETNQEKLIDVCIEQAKLTHVHNDSVYAAVFVASLIHALINGGDLIESIAESILIVKDHVSAELLLVLEKSHLVDYKMLSGGVGKVIDTMRIVLWSIRNTYCFKDAIKAAANGGGPSDTNAAITGAIAGALYGIASIPSEWIAIIDRPNKWNYWGGDQMTSDGLCSHIDQLCGRPKLV